MESLNIVMIGAGNLATRLSLALTQSGNKIIQVYSRTIENARILAKISGSQPICDLNQIAKKADLFIISVPDKEIEKILDFLSHQNKVVHTAGSVTIEIFKNKFENYGVFYPFQTFTRNRELAFNNVPVCIEANNSEFKLLLNKLAIQISDKIWEIDSNQRKKLNMAGVFAANFANHMYSIAGDILKEGKLPFELLHALIKETAEKAIAIGPYEAQTGPAKRNDTETQNKHLELLSSKPGLKQLYEMISYDISLKYNN
jgi:predicted short-subunit dehydrogenase-like oxidoreductase (DUF2520 family)